jgi:O-methyltransferase
MAVCKDAIRMADRRLLGVLRRLRPRRDPRPSISPADRAIIEHARPYTMTSEPRLLALIDAVRYCVRRQVPGALIECGVWRGGSVLAMILALQQAGIDDREIYLYDTFEGMTEPSEHDTSPYEPSPLEMWRDSTRRNVPLWGKVFDPANVSEDAVRGLVGSLGYPASRIHFVRGPVEQTLPEHAPPAVSLLRLDTDWYASTRHELVHLYPRLSHGGILIIDDYGHWEGARRAVDEYFASEVDPILLNRIDYTARIAVKV